MSIHPSETPTTKDWSLYPLFTVTKTGKLRIWHIGFIEAESSFTTTSGEICLVEEFGRLDISNLNDDFRSGDMYSALSDREGFSSRILESIKKIRKTKAKVLPKGKTLQQQAIQDARTKDKEKRDSKYVDDLEALLTGEIKLPFQLQLAESYFFPGDSNHNENLLKKDQIANGVVCQIKKDGERFSAKRENGHVVIRTRYNIEIPFLELQKAELAKLLNILPEGAILDGELFHGDGREVLHGIITTIVRHQRMDEVTCYIFDVILPKADAILEERIRALDEAFSSNQGLELVRRIANAIFYKLSDIKDFYEAAVTAKEEGIMIRKLGGTSYHKESLYRGGRNHNLLKVKPDQYGIAKIVAVEAAKNAHEGCAIFKLTTGEGLSFKCNCHGDLGFRRSVYKDKEKYIGMYYKYKYKQETAKGTPSHATGVEFVK
jgi:ATP-dependent DNA ligase